MSSLTSSDITQQKHFPSEVAASYPPGGVPRTPLELRVGPHPKKDHLIWKTPPSRQLSQQKRQEFELDVTERFYDDYMGPRTTGDSRNEVMTGVHKLGFNPDLYRMNALQGMAYDPSRPVPKHVNFQQMLRTEKHREQERVRTQQQQMRQRRLSDSMISQRGGGYYGDPGHYGPRIEPSYNLPKVPMSLGSSTQYQQSPLQKTFGDSPLNSEIVPEVEKWMANASQRDRDVATKFIRTISSQGQRPDPATKAATHSSRVRSAVMTPSRQQRVERESAQYYKQLERSSKDLPRPMYGAPSNPPVVAADGAKRRLRRSSSDVSNSKGMFTATRQHPAHFTIHPEWASEGHH